MSLPPPTTEQWTSISKLVSSVLQRPEAEPFREPVDWQRLGLYDYPKIIKKPMDLGTIKRKITDRKYKNLKSIDDDVKLVWTNCTTYNADGSDFFILAQNLNKKWIDKFTKFCNDFQLNPMDGTSSKGTDKQKEGSGSTGAGGGGPSSSQSASAAGAGAGGASAGAAPGAPGSSSNNIANTPNSKTSLDEKRSFARSLYKISKEDLGRVLVEVELKCPAALTKNSAEDEVEFNVDKLTSHVFAELVVFVKNCSSSGGLTGGGGGGGAANGSSGSGGAANGAGGAAPPSGASGGDASSLATAGGNPAGSSIGSNKSKKKSSSSVAGTKRQKT